ncbi:MAG: hypothetical protein K2N87_10865 [Eubacterium sp.]|nr:hypothetical protein [Eubacterium sp.]
MLHRKKAGRRFRCRELVCWEWKKLCQMPMLYIFLLLCVAFNMQLVFGSQYGEDYVAYVRQARQQAGSRMGEAFWARASEMADSKEKERLLRETKGAKDTFEDYDAMETAARLIGMYRLEGWAADALERKYQKQEPRIRELAASDASMEVGAAGMTKEIFDALFAKLCRAVLTQGLLFAVFAALCSSGSEQIERTWRAVYATKRGRYVQREKFVAGFVYATAAYGIVAVVSCAVFAGSWRLGEIWQTPMSTQFYDIHSMGVRLPFVTWADFTMRGYLAAVLLLGIAVVAVFYLFGYCAGLLAKNSYAAFLLLFLVSAFNFEVILLAGNAGRWGVYEAAMWTPVAFWWSHPLWFTDMGINAVVPWQECAVGALCLAEAAVLLSFGFRHYYRKDLK